MTRTTLLLSWVMAAAPHHDGQLNLPLLHIIINNNNNNSSNSSSLLLIR